MVTNTIDDNGDRGNKTATVRSSPAEITVMAEAVQVAFLGVTYRQYPAALILSFDKDIPGLTRDHIAAVSANGGRLNWTTGVLSGPDGDHKYTLPLIFGSNIGADLSATVTVTKDGYTISSATRGTPVTLLEARVVSMAAVPAVDRTAGAGNTKTMSIIFTFDRDIDEFTKEDIHLGTGDTSNRPDYGITTTKTGLTKTGEHEYTLAVSGIALANPGGSGPSDTVTLGTGLKSQRVYFIKNGYRFFKDPTTTMYLSIGSSQPAVSVWYEDSQVSGVTLAVTGGTQTIPADNTAWPQERTLTATVAATAGASGDTSAIFTFSPANPTGVTFTGSGNTKTLRIESSVTVGSFTFTATVAADPSKTTSREFIIEKNAGAVGNDAAFAAALTGTGGAIRINSTIRAPAAVMANAKTIVIENGGKLVVPANFTAKGAVYMRSGGSIEIEGGKILTLDTASSTPLVFGNDEVVFPAGAYSANAAGKKASLAFDGAAKSVTIGGDTGAEFRVEYPRKASNEPNYISFPLGYSLVIKQGAKLSTGLGSPRFDFGPSLADTDETGLDSNATAVGGDVWLTAVSNGLALTTTAPNGSVSGGGGFYSASGKALQFPAAGGGRYPLTIDAILTNPSYSITPGGGGVEISVTGTGVFTLSANSLAMRPSNADISVAVGRITGGSGTLSFAAYSNTGYSFSEDGTSNFTIHVKNFDLGGTSASPVGKIVLRRKESGKGRPHITLFGGAVLKAGGTAGSAVSSFAGPSIGIEDDDGPITTYELKGTGGKFTSIKSTGSGRVNIMNGSTENDFVIDASTVVIGE